MGFFKAYDMRGTYGVDFDLDLVRKIGYYLPSVVKGTRYLIGRDCRVTSENIRNALVEGLVASGVEVVDMGLCTTPMVYYFTAKDDFDGSVMITASHNPPSDNGLKVSKRTALPVGYAAGLDRVESLCQLGTVPKKTDNQLGTVPKNFGTVPSYKDRYIAFLKEKARDFSNLRFGVDVSNGMASLLAKDIFPEATIINDALDGTFPCHSPNPLAAEAREQISSLVRAEKLDLGVIFDGDADRAMFVDEEGRFIQPDYLIPVVARSLGDKGKVLHDVRTSRGAIEVLKESGFDPVMVPVGHAFAKPKMRETGAVCGGELAGHYYFRDFFGCDSGFLAVLAVLAEASKAKAKGLKFSEMMRPIVSRYANSGEINIKVASKESSVKHALDAAKANFSVPISESNIDGIRIDYAEGWFNLRASNTEPYLRLVAECDTKDRLEKWLEILKKGIIAV